jgi:hypothetical protein
MRLATWNCNMALHRKVDALLSLRPDVAVISECAQPQRLREKSTADWIEDEPLWMGRNRDKGLAVFAFNGYRLEALPATAPSQRYICRYASRGRPHSISSPSGRRTPAPASCASASRARFEGH